MKNTHNTQTKHNPEKSNNANHRKTKLAWLSRLKRQSATKRGGVILQRGSALGCWNKVDETVLLLHGFKTFN